jgi:hypothetical protein
LKNYCFYFKILQPRTAVSSLRQLDIKIMSKFELDPRIETDIDRRTQQLATDPDDDFIFPIPETVPTDEAHPQVRYIHYDEVSFATLDALAAAGINPAFNFKLVAEYERAARRRQLIEADLELRVAAASHLNGLLGIGPHVDRQR